MKGLVALFLSVTSFVIAWRYMSFESKYKIKQFISENLFALLIGLLAVSLAVFFSTNFSLRLV